MKTLTVRVFVVATMVLLGGCATTKTDTSFSAVPQAWRSVTVGVASIDEALTIAALQRR